MMVSNHDLSLGNYPISRLEGKGILPLKEHGDQFVTGWHSKGEPTCDILMCQAASTTGSSKLCTITIVSWVLVCD